MHYFKLLPKKIQLFLQRPQTFPSVTKHEQNQDGLENQKVMDKGVRIGSVINTIQQARADLVQNLVMSENTLCSSETGRNLTFSVSTTLFTM